MQIVQVARHEVNQGQCAVLLYSIDGGVLCQDSNTRLYFMGCNTCGASRSVAPIKSGYQAQIGKRKKK